MSFVYSKIDTSTTNSDTLNRIDLSFPGSNDSTQLQREREKSVYGNFYLGTPGGNKSLTGIHGNERLILPNIYPNIDLIYSSNSAGLKYYFVVKPGGIADSIKNFFSGADTTYLHLGRLHIKARMGEFSFDAPRFYQISTLNQILAVSISGLPVGWKYLSPDEYGFALPIYDEALPLIIEIEQGSQSGYPQIANISWSTYYGDVAGDGWYDVAFGNQSNSNVAVGSTNSTNYPVFSQSGSSGIYQGNNGGGTDATINQFDYYGKRNWMTYFGSGNLDIATTVAADYQANTTFFVGGYTSSGLSFQSVPGTSQNLTPASVAPQTDGFIAQFDNNGALTWGTHYGGSKSDYITSLTVDQSNNIYAVGYTNSSNFPMVGPYSQTCISGGYGNDVDGIIMKYTSARVLKYSYCYGGGGGGYNGATVNVDKLLDIDVLQNGNAIAVGQAESPIYPTTNPNSYSTYNSTLGSVTDGAIVEFDANGNRKWATLFGGNQRNRYLVFGFRGLHC